MKGRSTLYITRHMHARMSQRGIPGTLVHLVRQYGRYHQDRLILNRKDLNALLGQLSQLKQVVLKARDKGGLVVVEADGALITAYNLEGDRNG
jgi:hypothetical protein